MRILVCDDDKEIVDAIEIYPVSYTHLDVYKRQAHPELRGVLMKMDGILTDEEMSQLNYRVENDNEDEKTVAVDFLTQKGLL